MGTSLTFLKKIPLLIKVVSLNIILGGLILAGLTLVPAAETHSITTASAAISETKPTSVIKAPAANTTSGEPSTMSVARLGVNLPIKNGVYNYKTDEWTLSNDAAYYASMTSLPNDSRGNTFIYGHNNDAVLSPLGGLKVGDILTIKTTNGYTFTYRYSHDSIVPPDLTSVLYADPSTPQVTVMTCEGIFSQARRLMYFEFVGVS